MPSFSQRERIRQSWQPRGLSDTRVRLWLTVRRVTATTIAVGLIALCAFSLYRLLRVPRTYFVHATATTYRPGSGQPLLFAGGDLHAFQTLDDALAEGIVADRPGTPLTRTSLEKKLASLAELGTRHRDTLIVYLAAHGVVRDGIPQFILESEPGAPLEYYPVANVLEALKLVPAGTKLLLLDAGQDASHPRAGIPINTFPAHLKQAIRDNEDPTLWVLSANSPLERSHVSYGRRRSVFGRMVARAMAGAADRNGDQIVQLDELFDYVRRGVFAWVDRATYQNESQTPLLLHCDAVGAVPGLFVLSTLSLGEETLTGGDPVPSPASEMNATDRIRGAVPERAAKFAESTGAALPDNAGATGEADRALDAPAANLVNDGAPPAPSVDELTESELKAGTNYAALARWQLKNAWLEVARWEAPRSAASIAFPPQWRDLVERLLWCEQCCYADVPANQLSVWEPVLAQLRSILTGIKQAANDAERIVSPTTNLSELFRADATSLALMESVAAERHDPLPKELNDFVAAYDALLAANANSAAELDELLSKASTDGIHPERFYEFQWLDLRAVPDLPWELARLMLHVRRLGEQVAAHPRCGDGWCRESVESADRLRWDGERLVLDRTTTGWPMLAERCLTIARAEYARANKDLELIDSALRERNRLLVRIPHYVHWAHHVRQGRDSDTSLPAAIHELIASVARIDGVLAHPGTGNVRDLDTLLSQLRTLRDAIDSKLHVADNSFRMEHVLATALPEPRQREDLHRTLTRAENQRMASFRLPPAVAPAGQPPEFAARWAALRAHFDLERMLTTLSGGDEKTIPTLGRPPENEADRWATLDEARDQLAQQHGTVPPAIVSLAAARDMADPQSRPDRLSRLQAATAPWILLGPQHAGYVAAQKLDVMRLWNAARWYDLFAWNNKRFQDALDDAPQREVAFLKAAAENYRRLANEIDGQPRIAPVPAPTLVFQGRSPSALPDEIYLNAPGPQAVRLPFEVESTSGGPVWLVAQYDSDLIDVTPRPFYLHDDLRQKSAQADRGGTTSLTAGYPYRPDALSLPATEQLQAGVAANYPLTVRRKDHARGTTKLILKAISPTAFVRHELNVILPSPELLEVTVDAEENVWWSRTPAAISLHPLPNREMSFGFRVANRDRVEKTVAVAILKCRRAPQDSSRHMLPAYPLDPAVAAQRREPFEPVERLGPSFTVTVPPTGRSVALTYAPPDKNGAPPSNLLVADSAAEDKSAGVELPYGLLIELTDTQTRQVTYRRVEIAPPRPSAYLRARARFDNRTQRLQIGVMATDTNFMPKTPMRASLQVGGMSRERFRKTEDDLAPPDFTATVDAHLASNAPAKVAASIHVDNYPRAFLFEVSRAATNRRIEPVDNAAAVRLDVPKTDFKTPIESVPVTLQIDAPDGIFGYQRKNAFVEVGIDVDRDGELHGEAKRVLRSDRQLKVNATGLSPTGSLKLYAGVSDFQIDVPSKGLSEVTAPLLARLVVDGEVVASSNDSPETAAAVIHLDGAPPNIRVAVMPGDGIEQGTGLQVRVQRGTELQVRVFDDPQRPDRTGIALVEAVFESIASDDAATVDWSKGNPADSENWIVKLKTDDLALGDHGLLIRAADKVGNLSEPLRQEVTIVPKREASGPPPEQLADDRPNTVTGQVLYYDERMQAEVTLEAQGNTDVAPRTITTDSGGRFRFSNVSPGTYTLRARGDARGHYRNAEMTVTVPPASKGPLRLTVVAK